MSAISFRRLIWALLVLLCIHKLAVPLHAQVTVEDKLTVARIANRPLLQPSKVTLLKGMKFNSGKIVEGTEVAVHEIAKGELTLVAPNDNFVFAVKPADTDLVERAAAIAAMLPEEARNWTMKDLQKHSEAWPCRVNATAEMSIGLDRVAAGQPLTFVGIKNDSLDVLYVPKDLRFTTGIATTDFLDQVRKLLATPPDQRQTRYSSELTGKLQKLDEAGQLVASEIPKTGPRYLVLFFGNRTCGFTRQFTPSIVKTFNEIATADMQFVYCSNDESNDVMAQFMREHGIKFPAYRWSSATPLAASQFNGDAAPGTTLCFPKVVILDPATEKVIYDCGLGGVEKSEEALRLLRAEASKATPQ